VNAITAALHQAGLPARVASQRDMSGGCIHRVTRVELDDGRRFVAKLNDPAALPVFTEEAESLGILADTETVAVPRPLLAAVCGDAAVLLLTWVEPGPATAAAWRRLGEELAALHGIDVGVRYGFESDNHIGATPQPNEWCEDWVQFNARCRLGHQLRLAVSAGHLAPDAESLVQRVIDRLDRLLPRRPKPALLHGDLWSGNALPTAGERIAVIDPASSIGDGWADIAMMRLFGGFPDECLEAYARNVDDHENIEQRIAVYQLYHVLNHVNLFGGPYVSQALGIAARLGAA
jgi:fructosamine-3-kinase